MQNIQTELNKLGYQARMATDKLGIEICPTKDLEKREFYIADEEIRNKNADKVMRIILNKIDAKLQK